MSIKKHFSSRDVSAYTVYAACATLLLLFGAFLCGYVVGQRVAQKSFNTVMRNDSFSDHIHTTIDMLYGNQSMAAYYDIYNIADELDVNQRDEIAEQCSEIKYAAQLIGFGSKVYAQKFVARNTASTGPFRCDLLIRDRTSVTKKGKKITWFQVVTTGCDNKEMLEAFVKDISQRERLHDVSIVECTNLT